MAKADGERSDVQAILDSIDFGSWSDLRDDVEKLLALIAIDGVWVGFEQIRFDAPQKIVDQANEKAAQFATMRSAAMLGMEAEADPTITFDVRPEMSITESTREMLRSPVTAAIDEELEAAAIVTKLEDGYIFSAERAGVIAQFESALADVSANLIAYDESGVVVGKRWILGPEHVQSDICDDAAKLGVVPLDDDFAGFGNPPIHPKCSCDVAPVLVTDEEEEAA